VGATSGEFKLKLVIALVVTMSLAGCATTARAQRSPEMERVRERAALASCVAVALPPVDEDAAGATETYGPHGCIGEITRACHRELGDAGDTTAGLVICASREEEAWQALLVQSTDTLRQSETANQRRLLDDALAQGTEWARARCAYEASLYEGGSLARVLAAECLRNTTAERAIDLQRRLRDYAQ